MIAIIKYNAGNTASVENAVRRLDYNCVVTDDAIQLQGADKVIFPGVGHAAPAMAYLKDKGLDSLIKNLKQPVLGICLGMQLMCNYTEEGNTNGLGIFDTGVVKFPPEDKVPHMGWNTVEHLDNILFNGIALNTDLYFVHSYYAGLCDATVGVCQYIVPFSAALQKDNFYAVQFHPEKSGKTGEQFLKNFLQL
ncbi:imidazole glycerol phosphate synthase subunit HisH [Flavobacterium psychrotrophum]|uniref:imidazole glycerol phosphate synthase subunit HisH n=1 Tax=Flavobacterium psychrotrophum TaxID=2294119 RepID=UPI000E317BAF|nr:imidazole glycerol phosphate synthase subunit HisH [Flavobacterium psychrotrophum]